MNDASKVRRPMHPCCCLEAQMAAEVTLDELDASLLSSLGRIREKQRGELVGRQ